jgi:hypothetical protein
MICQLIQSAVLNPVSCIHLPITLEHHEPSLWVEMKGALDSAADGLFIDKSYAHQEGILTQCLSEWIEVYNVDGTQNEGGDIVEVAELTVHFDGHSECATFHVTRLSDQTVHLRLPWLHVISVPSQVWLWYL